jgi:hypothetical protein
MLKLKYLVLIFFLVISLLSACTRKKEQIPSTQAIIKEQYTKLLNITWAQLNPVDEKILKIVIDKEADGGATMEDIRFQQDEADALIKKKLLNWNTQGQKFVPTQFGKEVYIRGQELKNEEAKKPENLRNKKILKN